MQKEISRSPFSEIAASLRLELVRRGLTMKMHTPGKR
jgi:hypothetical protein